MIPAALDHDAIISKLKGKTLYIPNLLAIFQSAGWPSAQINPLCPIIVPLVNDTIRQIAAATKDPLIEKRLKDDIALLACLWYPSADPPRLRTLVLFSVWLVCWDDSVDAGEGSLAGSLAKADEWRAETLRIAEMALGLAGHHASPVDAMEKGLNSLLLEFGPALVETMNLDQRRKVFDELCFFVQSCATEQKLRLERFIPCYESYLNVRLGSIGGGLLCSLLEYANAMIMIPDLPSQKDANEMRTHVSVLLSLLNDLLSLKKELNTDCVINAVATLLSPHITLDEVVADIVKKIQQSVERFDAIVTRLINHDEKTEEHRKLVEAYADQCRIIVIGTLEFT